MTQRVLRTLGSTLVRDVGPDFFGVSSQTGSLQVAQGILLHGSAVGIPVGPGGGCDAAAGHKDAGLVALGWDVERRVAGEEVGGAQVDLVDLGRPGSVSAGLPTTSATKWK